MRRFAVVGIGLVSISLFSSATSAADLPAQTYPTPAAAPVLVPVVTYNWTGCHVGGHVGGVISEDRTTSASGSSLDFSSVGFVGGGQLGCDYQFAPSWLAGVEGRAAWSSLKNTHGASVKNRITGIVIPSQFTVSNDFLASATARLGYSYSFADRWLVFARGGAAWTHEKIDDAFTTVAGIAVDPSATSTRTGWTAGAGLEYALSQNWIATLEYDYYDFGSHGARLTSNNASVTVNSLDDTIHEATIGVDYHF
jgi:outer membrane immunogenic protein